MKIRTSALAVLSLIAAFCADGQGTTFLYDQQSSTQEFSLPYAYGPTVTNLLPCGQSFTPTLSAIDFIRLKFQDGNPTDGKGATLSLDLRSTSFTGPILGSTLAVSMPDGFTGPVSFFFSNTIPLTPGTTYYSTFNLLAGGNWHVDFGGYNYQGGPAYAMGNAVAPFAGFWFREGIIVPEPSSAGLVLLGAAAFACFRHRCRK